MKKIIAIAIVALTFTSCYKDPQSTTQTGNGFEVEFLFEHDGVKVYRFRDGGNTHYFTSNGETMSTKSSGKTHYEENIK